MRLQLLTAPLARTARGHKGFAASQRGMFGSCGFSSCPFHGRLVRCGETKIHSPFSGLYRVCGCSFASKVSTESSSFDFDFPSLGLDSSIAKKKGSGNSHLRRRRWLCMFGGQHGAEPEGVRAQATKHEFYTRKCSDCFSLDHTPQKTSRRNSIGVAGSVEKRQVLISTFDRSAFFQENWFF